jgi:hypothetical protein
MNTKLLFTIILLCLTTTIFGQVYSYKAFKYANIFEQMTSDGKSHLMVRDADSSNDLVDIDMNDGVVYISGGQEFRIIRNFKKGLSTVFHCAGKITLVLYKGKEITLDIQYPYESLNTRTIIRYYLKNND